MTSITTLVAISLLFSASASASELPPYEPNPEFKASKILSPQQLSGPNHTVHEQVLNDGLLNYYVVQTPFGDFKAAGNQGLARRIREARALAELEDISTSDVFLDASMRAVIAPAKALEQIAREPVATAKGIPGGLSRKFKSLGRKTKSGSKDVKEEVTDDSTGEEVKENAEDYASQWFGVTGAQRRWAEKLGVDPYTSNTLLAERIKSIAMVDAAASFAAKLAMPGLGVASYVATVSNLVWSLDGEELRDHNLEQLMDAGISEAIIEDFLDNPTFSPTQQTVITQSMLQMKDMDGLGKVLQLPDWVDNETEAWYYTEIIQLMARFSESMQRPLAIVGISMVPALLTQRDELVYVLPLDYLTWNKNLAGFVKRVMAPPVEAGEGGRAFWLNGVTTQTAAAGLRTLGWSIRTGISVE
jgi:hypothetical protein